MLMEKDKNLNQAAEAEAAAVEARKKQEMEDNPFLVFFKKPFTFEGVSYESVDLSGLESLSAADMIAVNKTIERGGTVNVLPEMSLEYACLIVQGETVTEAIVAATASNSKYKNTVKEGGTKNATTI